MMLMILAMQMPQDEMGSPGSAPSSVGEFVLGMICCTFIPLVPTVAVSVALFLFSAKSTDAVPADSRG